MDRKTSTGKLISKIGIALGLILILGLVTYRTLYPIATKDNKAFNFENLKDSEILMENDKVAFTVNLEGAVLHNFYFKNKENYGLFTNNSNNDVDNCFETLWMSNSKVKLPVRSTLWQLQSMEKTPEGKFIIVLHVILNNKKFTKQIVLDEYTVNINDDIISDNYNANKEDNILSYVGFSAAKTNQEHLNFISYLNNKKKILRVNTKTIHKETNQKISQHDGFFGVEHNLFIAICESDPAHQGNIFLRQNTDNEDINQIFELSYGLNHRQNTLYLLPKNKEILGKYNFQNLVDYGWLAPIAATIHYIFNNLIEKTDSVVISIFLLALLIILLNIFLIYTSEKEKYKMELYSEERQLLERNYKGKDLQTHTMLFYKRHNIKFTRMLLSSLLVSLWLFPLNRAFSLTFALKGKSFLWLSDLSIPDSYSLLNLYGLINFNPNHIPFLSYLSFDVLSILAALLMILLTNKVMANQQGGGEGQNFQSSILMKVIHYILFSTLCKSLSSGFMLCFITISIGNYLVSRLILRLLKKSVLKVN